MQFSTTTSSGSASSSRWERRRKTTKHPNTADFHFVLYKHNPAWGNRSAVQRFQCFFPDWFNRTVAGGNNFVDMATPVTPAFPPLPRTSA